MGELIKILKEVSMGNFYFIAFPAVLLLLFLFFRERRIRFVLPALIISLVLVNPLFYKVWSKFGLYGYWRVLWILPIIPAFAAVSGMLTEKLKTLSSKLIVTALCLAAFIACGTYMYSFTNDAAIGANNGTTFLVPAPNTAKLPENAAAVSWKLLELKEKPRVIPDPDLKEYLRQYSCDITTLYGRDVKGFIYSDGVSKETGLVYQELLKQDGNLSAVAKLMLNEGYDYLVVNNTTPERQVQLEENGFHLVSQISDYGIYTVEGNPTEHRVKNELGQVISITTLDEDGNPVNNEAGYATVTRDYDTWGNMIYEFRTDADGNGVPDGNGFAGMERVCDEHGQILRECKLSPDGKPLANSFGFAELRREYRGKNLIRESWYDAEGRAVNRLDTGCASVAYQRDRNQQITEERCYNADGDAIRCSSGWSVCRREYRDRKLIREAYYDTDDSALVLAAGYASMTREYDPTGNLIAESFFDTANQPVNTINGYAREERSYDSKKNLSGIKYIGSDGNPICICTGYAEVRREYDDAKNLVREAYFDESGAPCPRAAGYCAFEQEFDEEGKLILRRYLGPNGQPIQRTDGFSEARWEQTEDNTAINVEFCDLTGETVPSDRINLAKDIESDGWSKWMIPKYNTVNSCFNIGNANLGEKSVDDTFICQIEIEFSGVTVTEGQTFRFWTQGSVDGSWSIGNVWDPHLVSLSEPPADGIYTFTVTSTVNEKMVDASTFTLGFRCDYWQSGAFRVRNVKVEKGDAASSWSPGL